MFVEEMLENPPAYVESVALLIDWSRNFDPEKSPYALFLDLIGWSEEEVGSKLYEGGSLGSVEAHKLANALEEWSNRPTDVEDFINKFENLSMELA